MKNTTKTLAFAIIILIATITANAKEKIGVFDSRAVAIWNFNTDEFRKEMKDVSTKYEEAKKKKDTAEMKRFETRMPLMQRVLHDKGFGRGSVAEILEKNQAKLKTLAKSEKLIAIVSKWELLFTEDNYEVVDITVPLLKALGANDNTIKMYDEMKKQEPIKDAFYIED
jgi:hypothetical protein